VDDAASSRQGKPGGRLCQRRGADHQFEQRQPVEALRAALDDAGIKDSFIQYQREMGTRGRNHQGTPHGEGSVCGWTKAQEALEQAFSDLHVRQQDSVDPQVGKEFTRKSIIAVLASLIGIIIYITWRFEFSFSIGAVTALFHDALITVGVYCMLGRQLSMPIVAAVLTVIGYSVNDTIVVFDRIREDLKLYRGKRFIDVANLSLNQTLSRTALTSLTTLLSVAACWFLAAARSTISR
jgi:preprotein translocase SecF subunit